MADDLILIKPRALDPAVEVFADDAIMTDDGVSVTKATPSQIVNAGAPVATEAEAIAGTNNSKRMTPLTTAQVLAAVSSPSVTRAQAWAESETPPDPVVPQSKSSKTWSDVAGAFATSAQESAEQAELAVDKVTDMAFHLADYLHPSDFAAAKAGNAAGQNIDRVTASVQQFFRDGINALKNAAGANVRVRLVFLDGAIRINDEMIAEDSSQILWNGIPWSKRSSKLILDFRNIFVKAEFPTFAKVRTSGAYAEYGIDYPVMCWVLRLMKRSISETWLLEEHGTMTIDQARNPLTDVGGVYVCNVNNYHAFGDVRISNSCGPGIQIEGIFNSCFENRGGSACWNPTEYGDNYGLMPSSVTFSSTGNVVTANTPIFKSHHVGKMLSLGYVGGMPADGGVRAAFWSTIASVDSPTQVTLASAPTVPAVNRAGSFESLRGTIAASSDTMTLSAPITGGSLVGRLVFVVGTYASGRLSYGHVMGATIIEHSGATVRLNITAGLAVTDAPLVFSAAFSMINTDLGNIAALDQCDMVSLPRLWTEDGGAGDKCGVQLLAAGVHIDIDSGTKIHGCGTASNNYGGNFANAVFTFCVGFRFCGTSTHGGFSPRFGKHIFVGRQIDMSMYGESNYYPGSQGGADIYAWPLSMTDPSSHVFRIFYGMDIYGFGGATTGQVLARGPGFVDGMVRSIASSKPSPGGYLVPDTYLDGSVYGSATQASDTDPTVGKLIKSGYGGNTGGAVPPIVANLNSLNTMHRRVLADASTANKPSGATSWVVDQIISGAKLVQIAYGSDLDGRPLIAIRHSNVSSGWSGWVYPQLTLNGTTASRPASPVQFEQYFDTTLGKPVWYDGTAWKDASGTTV